MTPEEFHQIVSEALANDPPLTPEVQAWSDRLTRHTEELEAKGRPQATEEQIKIWQAWGEAELRRIDRENGETPE